MNEGDRITPEVEEIDRALAGVRFRPRASLGPEVLGRLRRGERAEGALRSPRSRPPLAAIAALAAALLLGAGAVLGLRAPRTIMVDRCCYDLDGGGEADDGVVVIGQRDAKVHQLRIYEDLDGSGDFTPGDLVRLDRGGSPAMHGALVDGLITVEHCCLDFDGGGPADDGLLVIGVPPDRVVMAAIYERSSDAGDRPPGTGGFLLR